MTDTSTREDLPEPERRAWFLLRYYGHDLGPDVRAAVAERARPRPDVPPDVPR